MFPRTRLFVEPLERRDLLAVTLNTFVVPATGQKGDLIALSADASSDQPGATLLYQWNFGDGTTASGANLADVSHAFLLPSPAGAPYDVRLTVSDGTSGTASADAPIAIADAPPTVVLNPSQTVHAGDAVGFNAAVTDPAGPADVAALQWDFNSDGSTFTPDASAAGQTNPSHIYATPGTYIVEVQATDLSGAVSIGATSVVVKPADALLVHAGPDQTVTASAGMMGYGNTVVSFNGSYDDPGGTVAPGGIAWDFNYDGSDFYAEATGTLTPTGTYYETGDYQVALQITDSTGATDLDVMQVQIVAPQYVGPTATAGPDQTINQGNTVSFNGSYTDPDGTVNPSSGVAWDFNYDGSTFNAQATGTLTPTYQFNTPGTYVVALQITDGNGLTSLDTLNVTVNGVAPTVSIYPPYSPVAGAPTYLYGSASGPGGGTYSYAWDFNYDSTTFDPSAADTTDPQFTFATPGTYIVALQATDAYGDVGLGTATVTVAANPGLVVNAGPDQFVNAGDTAAFNGAYVDNNASATVDPTTADWDFNYNGYSLNADPSAHGTLTPTHVFSQPGVYLVALRLTDSAGSTSTGLLYVNVADAPPTVSAGPDQTVAAGTTVAFAGTASDLGGPSGLSTIAWDFDYDGSTFNADSGMGGGMGMGMDMGGGGTLTPTHTFTAPGTYEVALQVTDDFGDSTLSTCLVTVTDVAPTATVSTSGPTPAETPVTFTVANVTDLNLADTVTYLVDWTGGGTFQLLTPDQLNADGGGVSFQHVYADPGAYNAVVELVDGDGGTTAYPTAVTVTEVPPTIGAFGPTDGSDVVTPTTPFDFANVSDVSPADAAAGFTYYVSVDGGAYIASSSPTSMPLADVALPSESQLIGMHSVSGYVVDSEGQASAVVTLSAYLVYNLQPPAVVLDYDTGGAFTVDWTGNANGPVTLSGDGSYTTTSAAGLTVTLLNSGTYYELTTNGAFDQVTAAPGVSNVNLSVDTAPNDYNFPGPTVGDGHVGVIDLPGGTGGTSVSTVSVNARGDLGSIMGPCSGGITDAQAGDLSFANLDGSLTGLDRIGDITATGWLGTSASQQVVVNDGIGMLTAYGVGATVQADLRQNANDLALWLSVGAGGVTGTFEAGNVGQAQIAGNVGVFEALSLQGAFSALAVNELALAGSTVMSSIKAQSINLLLAAGGDQTLNGLAVLGNLGDYEVTGNLTVTNGVTAGHIGTLHVTKNLQAAGVAALTSTLDNLVVGGTTTITGPVGVEALLDVKTISAGGSFTAPQIASVLGNVGTITVGQKGAPANLNATVHAGGNVQLIRVFGNFAPPVKTAVEFGLVTADGTIGDVIADMTIGQTDSGARIEAQSIGTISAGGDIVLHQVQSDKGDIKAVSARNVTVTAGIRAIGGDVRSVVATRKISGDITAAAAPILGPVVGFDGGNIWFVQSQAPLTNTITADRYIGVIKVTGGLGPATTAKIRAQGGAKFNPATGAATPQTLVVDVGAALFLGSVEFTYESRVSSAPSFLASFANGAPLFTLIDAAHAGPAGQTWTVNGPAAGSVNVQDVLFTWLAGVAAPGLQVKQSFRQNGATVTNWLVQ